MSFMFRAFSLDEDLFTHSRLFHHDDPVVFAPSQLVEAPSAPAAPEVAFNLPDVFDVQPATYPEQFSQYFMLTYTLDGGFFEPGQEFLLSLPGFQPTIGGDGEFVFG